MVLLLSDFIQASAGYGTRRLLVGDGRLARPTLVLIMLFDKQPIRFAFACGLAAHPDQRPVAFQLFSVERELQAAFG